MFRSPFMRTEGALPFIRILLYGASFAIPSRANLVCAVQPVYVVG